MAERKDRQERHDRDRVSRLDQPRDRHRTLRSTLRGRSYDSDRFGRFAESFARFMGTATFLVWMTIFIVVWVIWNASWGPERPRWDEYPFIFLTLILSLQASYAAPLILLAQNRQEARDRVQQEHDRDANAQSHADMEFLTREVASLRLGIGEMATRDFIRSELRGLAETLAESDDDAADHGREDDDRRSGQSH
ncbi:hypothetical protein ASD11_10495 [Aeromicrobium sp. Root495]|uniref:DUF1003 domain-containing protein n=1 Tax=Aeromicrobium sp. Root495 TaxID=1736550 RepID=UPI0006FC822B|nr:DUF1003 domain-containing protein [Aeromicrobium sp. Root495]KQY59926.1 hypothetical protein ASD11_10495 [Aeromicrobium sp. Root495]